MKIMFFASFEWVDNNNQIEKSDRIETVSISNSVRFLATDPENSNIPTLFFKWIEKQRKEIEECNYCDVILLNCNVIQ